MIQTISISDTFAWGRIWVYIFNDDWGI